jgi:hypothetical protein
MSPLGGFAGEVGLSGPGEGGFVLQDDESRTKKDPPRAAETATPLSRWPDENVCVYFCRLPQRD